MRAFVLKQHAVGKKSTATTRPRTTTPARPYRLHPVLALQRTVGNRAVQRILRAAHLRSPKRERGWLPSAVPQLLRSPDPKPPQTAAPKQPLDAGWTKVNELGIVWKEGALSEDGGANIHETPDGRTLEWLPQQTKVHILSQDRPSGGWYAVTAFGKSAQFGYIQQTRIWRNLPDPESEVALVKPGETPLGLAARHYGHKGFNVWGKDLRYVVNALVWVNSQAKHNTKSGPAIEKKDFHAGGVTIKGDDKAPWWTAQLRAGSYLWLPGVAYLNAIYDAVAEHGGGTGSITADLWRNVKKLYHYVAYGLAFAGGLIHGFFKSLWDAVAGLAHLIYDILKSLFTGHIVSDAKELAGKVHDLKWSDIKEAFGAWAAEWAEKLDSDSPWVAGHAHGYLTGYVMAEAAMLLLSGGAVEEIKAAVWGSRLGKALEETSAVRKFVEGANELRKLGGKTRETLDKFGAAFKRTRVGKATVVAGRAIAWTAEGIVKVLALPAEILQYLTKKVIAGLKRLEPEFERIKRFSQKAKRWLFGCHSPCDCDVDAMIRALRHSDDEIETLATRNMPLKTLGKGPEQLTVSVSTLESAEMARRAGVPSLLFEDGTVMTRADFPEILPERPTSIGRPAPRRKPPGGREVGRSDMQNIELRADIELALAAGAKKGSICVNQWQVVEDLTAGTNRPDLYFELANGQRVHIEYDRFPMTRALDHARRILTNDPEAVVILKGIGH